MEKISSPQGWIVYDYWPTTGQRKSVYTPQDGSDSKMDYYYDYLDRLEQVQTVNRNGESPNDEITTYSYNEVGSLKAVEYANGNYATYTYDSLNRLTNLVHKNSSHTTLASYAYTLAADGMRESVTESNSTGTTRIINWYYDALNRLVTEDYNSPDDANDFAHTYVYDLVGNRLEKQIEGEPNTIYSYDPNNDELDSETTDSNSIYYSYDDNGSLIQVLRDNDANSHYTYDYCDRLATADNDTNTVTYTYNAQGIRVKSVITGGSTTNYLIDPYNHTGYAQVFKEKVTGGSETVYITGLDILAQATGSNAPKYMLYDGHGSVRQVVQSSSIIGRFAYDGYGNAHGFNPASAATALLYAGEQYDNHLQMYNLRARWYSPANGRFNRMDPFAGNNRDPQSLHKYLYAHCNPVMNVDPSGMYSFGELLAVSALVACIFGLVAGEVVRIKGGAQEQIEDAQWKWFWIGFFAGAIVYSGFWAYAVLTAPAALSGPTIQQLINDTPRIQHSFDRHWHDILNHFNELRPIAQQVLSKPQAVKEGVTVQAFSWP